MLCLDGMIDILTIGAVTDLYKRYLGVVEDDDSGIGPILGGHQCRYILM